MGYVLTFAQQKGGSGKTTLVANLAHAWVLAKKSVALIDLDPQQSLTEWSRRSDLGLEVIESRDYRVSSDLRTARDAHDLVLVDCPGSASSLLASAVRESDLLLVPCQPTPLDLWASEATLRMAADEKTPARVVLNRVAPRGAAADKTVADLEALGAGVLRARIGNRVAFATAFLEGGSALGARRSRAAEEVTALRKELDRLLKKL